MEFVGPLPKTKSGNRYLIVATEALTRWPEAKAVKDATARTAAAFLWDLIMDYGAPETIPTDRVLHFLNQVVERLTSFFEIRHLRTSGYRPQTNGLTERFNGTLCKALAKMAAERGEEWDQFVPVILFAYRTRRNPSTGVSPFEAMYGVRPRLLEGHVQMFKDEESRTDYLEEVRGMVATPTRRKVARFRTGDRVLLRKPTHVSKLESPWAGPFLIRQTGPGDTYLLESEGEAFKHLVNGDRLREFHEREGTLDEVDESGKRRRDVVTESLADFPKGKIHYRYSGPAVQTR